MLQGLAMPHRLPEALQDHGPLAYLVKRYPRYSETFVVNEILAHEEAGQEVVIFSLLPPEDGHFQDVIGRVRAPVVYLPAVGVRAREFWSAMENVAGLEDFDWPTLDRARGEDPRLVYQALLLAHELRTRGVPHLHAHFASAATTVARLAASFAGIPFSFTAHAKDIFHESVDPADLGRKLAAAQSTVTVSRFNIDHLRRRFPEQTGRLAHVDNGLLLERFPFSPPEVRPPVVVAVARLVEKKGFDLLIEAMGILRDRGVDARCRIIGQGPLRSSLEEQITRAKLVGIVSLEGPRPQTEVAQVVSEAAVLVAPCRVGSDGNRDGLPTILLEAMALGTPCVATPVTGIPELIEDGSTGLLVPEEDAPALASAMARLLEDAELRARLAAAGRARVERHYDARRNAASLRRLFGVDTRASMPEVA